MWRVSTGINEFSSEVFFVSSGQDTISDYLVTSGHLLTISHKGKMCIPQLVGEVEVHGCP